MTNEDEVYKDNKKRFVGERFIIEKDGTVKIIKEKKKEKKK